jgi:hypothetical protein
MKKRKLVENFDLLLFIRRLIERKHCPLFDDEGEPSGQTDEIIMATIDVGDIIELDMASGKRFIVSIRKKR